MDPHMNVIEFDLDESGHPVTTCGDPVTCDGCTVVLVTQPGPDRQRMIPSPYIEVVYEQDLGDLNYVVCERGSLCLDLAELADEMFYLYGCGDPQCPASPCHNVSSGPA